MSPSWLLDEMAHAGPEHLDPAYVDGYDRKQGHPDPSDDIALLGEHGIGPASTVVDLGAGTGRFALAIAPQVSRVVAVDVSAAMRAHIAAADSMVDVVAAGFLTYRHDGGPADAVYTRNALHQIPDLFKALALQRIAEMLRPGGVLLLRDLVFDAEPAELPGLVERWFSGAVRDPARGYTAEDTPSICGPNSARSAGCSNRCFNTPGLTLCRSNMRDRSTVATSVAAAARTRQTGRARTMGRPRVAPATRPLPGPP